MNNNLNRPDGLGLLTAAVAVVFLIAIGAATIKAFG